MTDTIKVRFAPSPTGPFHIGGARSALFNWLVARHRKGTFLVRIEDTDLERSSRASEENIKESLKWLGLDWDEGIDVGGPNGPYRQTERLDIYKKEVECLLAEGKAYYCYCSPEELEASRQAQVKKGLTPVYDGRCEHLTQEQIAQYEQQGRKPVIRLKVRKEGVFAFDDMVRGHVEFQAENVGDFIIMKSDGIPVYNFAVVVDDALMGITHVIRAEEHLSNTPRQLAIYEALGYKEPIFGHISLILGSDHKKMSKRHGATSVTSYKEQGYLPEAMINYLALLGWAPKGEQELFTVKEMINQFSMKRVSSNDAVFDIEKLNWINFQYMKKLSADELYAFVLPFIKKAGLVPDSLSPDTENWLKQVVWFIRDHLSYGEQVVEHIKLFFAPMPEITDEELKKVLRDEGSQRVLRVFYGKLQDISSFDEASIMTAFKESMKETGIKGKAAFQPIRIALTGATQGPGVYKLMELFGQEKTLSRIQAVLLA